MKLDSMVYRDLGGPTTQLDAVAQPQGAAISVDGQALIIDRHRDAEGVASPGEHRVNHDHRLVHEPG
jgi:hypothetical protein